MVQVDGVMGIKYAQGQFLKGILRGARTFVGLIASLHSLMK